MYSIIEKLALIERMHLHIRRRGTGNPEQFARRLGISKSSLHRHIELMKLMGAPIAYNVKRGSYEYAHETDFQVGFSQPAQLTELEMRRTYGGQSSKTLLNVVSSLPSPRI